MNEEFFRLYALWTFAISSVYTIIYLGIFLNQYRTAFFIFLGIITLIILLYWFRDGGNKAGWQSLDESILITLFLSVISFTCMVISCVVAVRMTSNLPPTFDQFRSVLIFVYKVSPIALTAINLVNLLIFIVRN